LNILRWPAEMGEFRTFVASSLQAFPALVEAGPGKFVVLEMSNKQRKR
jgi:hypothetical protein